MDLASRQLWNPTTIADAIADASVAIIATTDAKLAVDA